MIYIPLTIIFTVILSFIFKYLESFDLNRMGFIIVNYLVCFLVGLCYFSPSELPLVYSKPWFPYSLLLSGFFIVGFNVFALAIKHYGISISNIMQKMSLLLSAIGSILLYKESVDLFKVVGISIGVVAVVLINLKKSSLDFSKKKKELLVLLLPLLVLLISSFIELGLQFVQKFHLPKSDNHTFNSCLFLGAGVLGYLYAKLKNPKGSRIIGKREILAGVFLGVPNYYSIHFLVKAFESGLDGSMIFPIVNISILLLAVLGSVLFFKEKLARIQLIGLALSILAIISIAYSAYLNG